MQTGYTLDYSSIKSMTMRDGDCDGNGIATYSWSARRSTLKRRGCHYVVVRHLADLRQAQQRQEPDERLLHAGLDGLRRRSAATCSTSASTARAAPTIRSSEKITFVGRVIGGHIEGWGGDDIRLTDLYYRGGETIRGFDRGGFGPRDLRTDDAIGGKTYWATTAEIRFPFPFIPDDLGSERRRLRRRWLAVRRQRPGQEPRTARRTASRSPTTPSVRSSVGASVMWNSPVGPIRMDFAKALTKEDFDKEQFFRFGASTKF